MSNRWLAFGFVLITAIVFAVAVPREIPAQPEPLTGDKPLVNRADWHEIDWSKHLAETVGGEAECQLPDGSRVDILTNEIAWEVEWSDKWEESIGQSLKYAKATGRKPGVWLLLRGRSDEDWIWCVNLCRDLGIEIRTETVK